MKDVPVTAARARELPFLRERVLAVGSLALLAPVPLFFANALELLVLVAYAGALGLLLLRTRRGAVPRLPNVVLNLAGLAYLPVVWADVRFGSQTLLKTMLHLLLFTTVLKLAAIRKERDLSLALVLSGLLFVAAVSTSFHVAILGYVVLMALLAWTVLVKWALWRDLAAAPEEWERDRAAHALPGAGSARLLRRGGDRPRRSALSLPPPAQGSRRARRRDGARDHDGLLGRGGSGRLRDAQEERPRHAADHERAAAGRGGRRPQAQDPRADALGPRRLEEAGAPGKHRDGPAGRRRPARPEARQRHRDDDRPDADPDPLAPGSPRRERPAPVGDVVPQPGPRARLRRRGPEREPRVRAGRDDPVHDDGGPRPAPDPRARARRRGPRRSDSGTCCASFAREALAGIDPAADPEAAAAALERVFHASALPLRARPRAARPERPRGLPRRRATRAIARRTRAPWPSPCARSGSRRAS